MKVKGDRAPKSRFHRLGKIREMFRIDSETTASASKPLAMASTSTHKNSKTTHRFKLAADFQYKACGFHSLGSVIGLASKRLRNLKSRFLLKSCLVARYIAIVVLSGSCMNDAIASPSVYRTASSLLRCAIGTLCASRSREY